MDRGSQIERLERLAALSDAAEPLIELAELRLRMGEPVAAVRALNAALARVARDSAEGRQAQRLLSHIEGKHGIICVERAEYDATVRRLAESGRTSWGPAVVLPRRQKKRAIVLRYILEPLEPGREYTGAEVEAVLHEAVRKLKLDTDHCHLRRYMLGMGMLERTPDGATYWLSPTSPVIVTDEALKPARAKAGGDDDGADGNGAA